MRSLFRTTATLCFGSGVIQGGVKKVSALKIDYGSWALRENTRNELAPLHHPLVTEYFVRLHEKNEAIERAQEATGSGAVTLTNKVDGSPLNQVAWNATYRDELETAAKMTGLLRELDETIGMRDQLAQKKADGGVLSDEDTQILEVIEEEVPVLLSNIRELDDSVNSIMERRLESDDAVGSSSKTWEILIAGKAGGEEAGLFAGELAEMLKAYATDVRSIKVVSTDEGQDAGGAATTGAVMTTFGSFKYLLQGENVYRYFHHEIGVHKVQRVPVTDAAGKMQTSTAVVTMMPVLDPVSVDVHESDCNIDYVRGSGPGGQGMQSSSNCVVLTHRPSGISVKCHQSRSALGNKELALQMVAQQILARRVREQNSTLHDAWRNQWTSGERSEKMRTYNYPQNRVTDHRIGKDYPLTNFMDRGKGLKALHDELNELNDRDQLNSVLLKHIKGEFGTTL